MKTIVERAARALRELDGHAPDIEDDNPTWQNYLSNVRAVLQAIREPTDGMMEAGAEIIRNVGPSESPEAHRNDAANTWRFMVDEALSARV